MVQASGDELGFVLDGFQLVSGRIWRYEQKFDRACVPLDASATDEGVVSDLEGFAGDRAHKLGEERVDKSYRLS